MKEIQLTQGKVALVDDDMFDYLNQWKWYALYMPTIKSFYAIRTTSKLTGKRKAILMHRIINNTPEGEYCDHNNHDTLFNLRENLRNCTRSENMCNSEKRKDNTSGYKGVSFQGEKWRVQIQIDGKKIHIGVYETPEEAARAYDKAAIKYHGEFAQLNYPND